jgi:hypothetical protein
MLGTFVQMHLIRRKAANSTRETGDTVISVLENALLLNVLFGTPIDMLEIFPIN